MGKNKSVISTGSKDSGGASIASITSNRSTFSTMASSKNTAAKKNSAQQLKKTSASVIDSKKAPSVYDEILKTAFKKKPVPSTSSKGHTTDNIKQEKKKKDNTLIPTQGNNDPYIEVPDEPPSVVTSQDRNEGSQQIIHHELHQEAMSTQESQLKEAVDQTMEHPRPLSTQDILYSSSSALQVAPVMTTQPTSHQSVKQQNQLSQSSTLMIPTYQPVDHDKPASNKHERNDDMQAPRSIFNDPKQTHVHSASHSVQLEPSTSKPNENALSPPETNIKESIDIPPMTHPTTVETLNERLTSKDDTFLSNNNSVNVSRVLPTETPVERISKITEEEKLKVKTFASRNLRYNDPDELFNFKTEDIVASGTSSSAVVENVFVVPQLSIEDVHEIIEEHEECKKSDGYPSEEEGEVIPHKSQELIFNDDVVVFESPEEDAKTLSSTGIDGSSDFDLQEAAELAVSTERLDEHLQKTLNLERENQLLEREIKHLEQEIKTKYSNDAFEKAFPVVEILSKPRGSKSIERYSETVNMTAEAEALKPPIESNENDEDLKFELELLKIVGEDFKNRKNNAKDTASPPEVVTATTTTTMVSTTQLPNQTLAPPVEPPTLTEPKQDSLPAVSAISSQSQRLAEYKARRNARMKQAQNIIPSIPVLHPEPTKSREVVKESKVESKAAPSITDAMISTTNNPPTLPNDTNNTEEKIAAAIIDKKESTTLNETTTNFKPTHSQVQLVDTTQELNIQHISPIKTRSDKALSPIKASPNRKNISRSMDKSSTFIAKEDVDHPSFSKHETLSRVTYLEKFMKDLKRKKQEEFDAFETKFAELRAYFEKQLEARDNAVHHLTHQNRMLKEKLTLTQSQIDDLSMVIEHILESQEKMEEAISVNNSKVITPKKGSNEMEDEPVSPVSGGGIGPFPSTSGEIHHQEDSTTVQQGPITSDSLPLLSPSTIKKRFNRDFEDERDTLLETPKLLNIQEGISVGLSNDGDVYLSIGKSSVPLGEYIKTL